MNRYNFIKAAKPAVSAAEISNATKVNGIEEILKASALIGEYQFAASEDLSKVFATASAVETEIATRSNGSEMNRVRVTLPNGKTYLCRAYGVKNSLLPPRKWTAKEIATIQAGFCTSDGERVEETRQSPTGELLAVPVLYVRLA